MSINASLSFCCISFKLFNSLKWLVQCFILFFGHFGCHENNYIILCDIAPLSPVALHTLGPVSPCAPGEPGVPA